MHINNVRDYAPEGHKYITTEYAEGRTRHVFASLANGQEIALEHMAKDADEERGLLEVFKAQHEGKEEPEEGEKEPESDSFEAFERPSEVPEEAEDNPPGVG
ncbi:MAG TPA: hypothetical protein VED01_03425 [Burkholderiales bacterium]|nr:hypothetical protein [Burkholderiales bacterium]